MVPATLAEGVHAPCAGPGHPRSRRGVLQLPVDAFSQSGRDEPTPGDLAATDAVTLVGDTTTLT